MKPASVSERDGGLVAPRWHTAVLVALYVSVASAGLLLAHTGVSPSALPGRGGRIARVYLPLVLTQWGLLLYVARVGRTRSALGALLGTRWSTARRACEDVALALLGWALLTSLELLSAHLTATHSTLPAVAALLPATSTEKLAWVLVSLTVGFCEEVVFRGYFQAQFASFTRSAPLAIALQAMLFGLAHGEQGLAAATRAVVYGLGFGMLAHWRRSLAPGIVCHVWTDLASGLLGI